MKCRADFGKTVQPYRGISRGEGGREAVDFIPPGRANGSYIYDIGTGAAEPPRQSSSCRRVRGFYLGEGTLDEPAINTHPDIMDGVCIRPQRNGGTNPIFVSRTVPPARTRTTSIANPYRRN